MDIYTVSPINFMQTDIIEHRISTVWTERHSTYGEIELEVESNARNKSALKPKTWLGKTGSYRIMEVQTVLDTVNDDGKRILKVKGEEISRIFKTRTCRYSLSATLENEKWVIKNKKPADLMRYIFDITLRQVPNSGINYFDRLDRLQPQALRPQYYPTSNIPEPGNPINVELPLKPLDESLKSITDSYSELGWRLYADTNDPGPNGTGQMFFDVYTGIDRSQSRVNRAIDPIIFKLDWGNLTNTQDLDSIANLYNTAYVFSPNKSVIVDLIDGSPAKYYNRRVLTVDVDESTEMKTMTSAQLDSYLRMVGKSELAKHTREMTFDGEIPKNAGFKYGKDYFLGDRVTLMGDNGNGVNMRVSEHISTEDSSGEKEYPTLKVADYITAGTWSGMSESYKWIDMPGTWAEQ